MININVREYLTVNLKKDNPEKLPTQDEEKQNQNHNMCWTTLYTSKHKQHRHDMLPATKKTCSLLQATDGKYEPNIAFIRQSQGTSKHGT